MLFTETFGTGTPTTLPTGWSAQTVAGPGTWKYTKVETTGDNSIGDILSTSASDGWMVYDSDSLGGLSTAISSILEGTLTSPVYNLTGQSAVEISFQQHFRRFRDSCFLEVTNNNFTTFTRYAIQPNNTILSNQALDNNPELTRINVSAVAGNQATVRFRFRYKSELVVAGSGNGYDGSYNWLVDDVAISVADPVDVAINRAFHLMTLRNGTVTTFGDYPRQLLDSVYLYGTVSNYGNTAQTGTQVSQLSYNNTTASTAFTASSTVSNLPVNTYGETVRSTNGFIPTTNGLYINAVSTTATGDASATNNQDSTYFRVTDSVLSTSVYNIASGYYLTRPGSGTSALSNAAGILFDIPFGHSDTVTGFSFAFYPAGNGINSASAFGANARFSVQLYSIDTAEGAQFEPIATSVSRAVTSADISTNSTPRWAYFPVDFTGTTLSRLTLGGGSYAAMVQISGLDANSTAVIASSFSMAPRSYFIPGLIQSSSNDGSLALSGLTLGGANGVDLTENVPLVRVHFANNAQKLAVSDVAPAQVGAAFPNPANTLLTVPFQANAASDVTVSISNPMGQVIASQNLGRFAAGQKGQAVFNTAAIASGLYFYTVEAGGQRIANRVVVAH